MKNRQSVTVVLLIVLISLFSQILNVSAENDEDLAIREGDTYFYLTELLEVEEYIDAIGSNPYTFEGANSKIEIEHIYKADNYWELEIESTIYTDDSNREGTEGTYQILEDPGNESAYWVLKIFIPKDAENYLDDWDPPADYSISKLEVKHETTALTGKDLEEIWTYQANGIRSSYVIKHDGEEIFREILNPNLVSFGFYFLGFMAIALAGIIIITIKKYRGGLNK